MTDGVCVSVYQCDVWVRVYEWMRSVYEYIRVGV
jgi:hypothetical protein